METPFIAGAVVCIEKRGRFERFGEIAKVYKNGNFILVGDATKQQYKPSFYHSSSNWVASSTENVWNSTIVRPNTPEQQENVQAASRARQAQSSLR
jgi:hypothetical protein